MGLLRTDVLARLLLERILRIGPMTEPAAVVLIESRAPGRGHQVIEYAQCRGMIRVQPGVGDEPATITAPTPERIAA
jgi:hypothetical protein